MTNRAPAGILKPVRPPPRKDSQMAGSERHGIPQTYTLETTPHKDLHMGSQMS